MKLLANRNIRATIALVVECVSKIIETSNLTWVLSDDELYMLIVKSKISKQSFSEKRLH